MGGSLGSTELAEVTRSLETAYPAFAIPKVFDFEAAIL
jgi:hypothetical protein